LPYFGLKVVLRNPGPGHTLDLAGEKTAGGQEREHVGQRSSDFHALAVRWWDTSGRRRGPRTGGPAVRCGHNAFLPRRPSSIGCLLEHQLALGVTACRPARRTASHRPTHAPQLQADAPPHIASCLSRRRAIWPDRDVGDDQETWPPRAKAAGPRCAGKPRPIRVRVFVSTRPDRTSAVALAVDQLDATGCMHPTSFAAG